MKLKIVTVDLELSPRAKACALFLGVPLVLLLARAEYARASGDAGAGLVTWSSNQTLTADDLNANFNYLQTAVANCPIMTDWQPYTPTVSNMGSSQHTTTAKWRRVGDSAEIRVQSTLTESFTSVGGHGGFQWSLPNGYSIDTAKLSANESAIGHGIYLMTGTNSGLTPMDVAAASARTMLIQSGPGNWFAGNGQTYNSGDTFILSATVPIVGWTYNH